MAAQKAVQFNQQLEAQRRSLTANQLKKARKKRSILFQKAMMADLVDGCQPAAKRIKFDDNELEASVSQLQGTGGSSRRELSTTADSGLAATELQPGSSHASGTTAWQVTSSVAAVDGSNAPKGQQQHAHRHVGSQQKPQKARPLQRLKPRSSRCQLDARAQGGLQAADMSDMVKMLQHQAHKQQDQQAADEQRQCSQQCTAGACIQRPAERQAAAAAMGPCGSHNSSTGLCRTDLSGQLVVIKQELSSNGSTGYDSSSTIMQVKLVGISDSNHDSSTHSSQDPHDLQDNAAAGDGVAAAVQAAGQQQQPQRKRQRASCQYGNYHHYYGYRIGPSGFEDPRLKVLDQAWFKGADVLDVGCNEGLLTLALAVGCGCHSITGVDIDPVLVAKACTNLSRTRTQLTQQMRAAVAARDACAYSRRLALPPKLQGSVSPAAAADGPLTIVAASSAALLSKKYAGSSSNSTVGGKVTPGSAGGSTDTEKQQEPEMKQQNERPNKQQQQSWQDQREQHRQLQASVLQLSAQIKSLTRVSFKAGNWLHQGCPANKYEVVTCFSVTKWIHLNWGDDGLMQLFNKFYRCLAPGGLLVLEPQPWKSYQSAVHKQGGTAAPFQKVDQLKLRPEGFAEYLTQRVGFVLVQQLSAVSQAAGAEAVPVKGFDRPILVLRKPSVQQ